MGNLLIIFRGWSSTPSLYRGIEKIYEGWNIIYDDEITSIDMKKYEKIDIFAWSMGTLDAIGFERKHKIHKMILVSPTLDFTSTTRPVILKKMIKRLLKDKEGCLEDFTKLCFDDETEGKKYWAEYKKDILNIDTAALIKGLEKLLNKKIEAEEGKISPLIILASDDRVISKENSQSVVDVYPGAAVCVVEGGHNLLYSREKEVLDLVKKYQNFT